MLSSILEPHRLPAKSTPHRISGLVITLKPGESSTLADISGPGCIKHYFQSMQPRNLRHMILRMWWDGEEKPSVECPVSDFFGIGHDETTAKLNSPFFYVAPHYGYNCYLPMPFASRAKITLSNEGDQPVSGIYLMIDFVRYREPLTVPWRFHMAWRRVFPAYRRGAGINLLEAKGQGRLIGLIYHVVKRDSDDRWTHGGGDQIFIDGETADPGYIYGIGGEDFAHHAWGLYPGAGPFTGCHQCHPVPGIKRPEGPMSFEPHGFEQHDGGRYSMYRFFVPDAIPFEHSIRMTFGTAANEISATTYWYQNEPHTPFCSLPTLEQRRLAARVTDDETCQPLELGQSIPVAVLGPMMRDDQQNIWSPSRGVDLAGCYETSVKQPYGDVVAPPYQVRWRRGAIRGGFIDLAAIHRPKCAIRPRGLWNLRHLPIGSISHQLIRLRLQKPRRLCLRLGYEDQVWVWLAGQLVQTLHRPEPDFWQTQDVMLDIGGGWQDLVLTHSQDRWAHWSAWALYAKLLEEDGSPAQGLEFDALSGLDPTPERFREPWPLEAPIPTGDYRDPAYLV